MWVNKILTLTIRAWPSPVSRSPKRKDNSIDATHSGQVPCSLRAKVFEIFSLVSFPRTHCHGMRLGSSAQLRDGLVSGQGNITYMCLSLPATRADLFTRHLPRPRPSRAHRDALERRPGKWQMPAQCWFSALFF